MGGVLVESTENSVDNKYGAEGVSGYDGSCCCPPTPLTLVCGGDSDHPAFGPSARLSLHLVNSSIIPGGSIHKSRDDKEIRIWVQLKRWCVSCV